MSLAVQFLFELGALAALGFWGFTAPGEPAGRFALGIGAPLLAVAAWATFGSPRARRPATGAWRLLLELLFFGSAAAGLAAADQPALSIVFALAVAGNIALLRALGTDADARQRAWRG